ncbi:MAG: tetratricopeptide repeat protein, partial [Gemmatimonadetes bacterium]|nr:tetratricopeptide repeat protein [Gemmatimonadota bacterium]
YGNGLQAMDRGDYAEAVRLFQQAVQLDPSLGAARERQGEAAQLQRAGEVTPQQIAQTGLTELPAAPAAAARAEAPAAAVGAEDLLRDTRDQVNSTPATQLTERGAVQEGGTQQGGTRNPAQEGQQQEGVTQAPTARVRVCVPNPFTGKGC